MRFIPVLKWVCLFFVLASCAPIPQEITAQEQALLQTPNPRIRAQVQANLPRIMRDQIELEAHILAQGRSLTKRETALARAVHVTAPERIRLLTVPHIPLQKTADQLKKHHLIKRPLLQLRVIGGLQAGYGVVIAQEYITQDWLVAHEFAHVGQFEKLGRKPMLQRVLTEHAVLQGKLIPIERDAIALSKAATGITAPSYHP